ncbi:hypothetical protein [Pseudovibrio sp. WM33]|uniref:hypothetical protein n=1 Tax=Pseudovibrio sp. WM33 TaxID=1735585 RepID=UPI0007AE9135|nr:hypothetical protein [Pseudovibrio sp. WM33]KZL26065.1 hypothetical protein PsWM33_01590 [Pseudovibrio sp. WM33]
MEDIECLFTPQIIAGFKRLSVDEALFEAFAKLDEYGLDAAATMISNNEFYASNISSLSDAQKHALISKLRPLIIYAQLSLKFSEVPQ